MPILPAEPDFYPPDLWEAERTFADASDAVWWCLHTMPRQEKAIARELHKQRLTYYLPQMIKDEVSSQGRRTRSLLPLFSSYLFRFGDDHSRVTALKGDRLVNVLEVVDQEPLERDLRQINRMLHSGLPITPNPSVPIGAKVRIVIGPLVGMVGTVIRRGNSHQFVAVVDFLGQGAVVDLHELQFEQIYQRPKPTGAVTESGGQPAADFQ